MTEAISIQDRYAPQNRCYGCGPANEKGFRIKSFARGDELICDWTPQPWHLAFPGILCGGVIGTLLDCHSNWAAAWHLMPSGGDGEAPCTVTSDFTVRLLRPTPLDGPVHLIAKIVSADGPRVKVESTLTAADKVSAMLSGTFVSVPPGHPAHHQWR